MGDKNDGGNNMANQQQVNWEYPTSAAISNLHMLQKLDHTYAEVLKKASAIIVSDLKDLNLNSVIYLLNCL